MKLKRLRLKGLSTAFPDEVEVDFDALGEGVTCIVGGNGSGKSHLLAASAPTPIYGDLPDYGESFTSHVTPGCRDALVDLVFEMNGSEYRVLRQCDPQFGGGRGKTEAYVYRDGQALAGPLLKDAQEAISKILPSEDVFLASVFAAQGGPGSMFNMPRSGRKALFAEMLNLGELEQLSATAKDRHGLANRELDRIRDQIANVAEKLALTRGAKARLDAMSRDVDIARETHAGGQKSLSAAEAQHAKASENLQKAESEARLIEQKRLSLSDSIAAKETEVRDLESKVAELQDVLSRADTIEQAVRDVARLEQCVQVFDTQEKLLRDESTPIEVDLATRQQQRSTLKDEYRRLATERDAASQTSTKLAELPTLLTRKATIELDLRTAEQALEDSRGELKQVTENRQAYLRVSDQRRNLEERLSDLDKRSKTIEGVDIANPLCAACPLTQDTKSVISLAEGLRKET